MRIRDDKNEKRLKGGKTYQVKKNLFVEFLVLNKRKQP